MVDENGQDEQKNAILPFFVSDYCMAAGVHDEVVTGAGGVGGVAQGMLVKSKKSSKLGWAASRAVRCAVLPIKRFSTNLITAVWSIGM